MGWFSRDDERNGERCPDCGKFNRDAQPTDRCSVCNGLLSHDGSTNAYPRTKGAKRKGAGFFDGIDFSGGVDGDLD